MGRKPSPPLAVPVRWDVPAGARDELHEQADDAMRTLRGLISCVAYELSAWDPFSSDDRHERLAGLHDGLFPPAPRGAERRRNAFRDWGFDAVKRFTAEELLKPRVRSSASESLRLPDGRYTGTLQVGWASPGDATSEHVAVIGRFRPLLANICDLLRSVRVVAEVLAPSAHAMVFSADGVASDVPGRPTGRALGVDGALRALVLTSARNRRGRFLWQDDEGDCHSVTLRTCRGGPVLVTEEAVPWPYRLTHRELEVLHLVAGGLSNPEIGRRLGVSRRTVSTHVEHILGKVGCASRSQLAATAVGEGLLLVDGA